MQNNDVVYKWKQLRDELRLAISLIPFYKKGEKESKSKNSWDLACKLLFQDGFYNQVWEEEILLKSQKLFQPIPPNKKVWGEDLQKLRERTELVTKTNDFFFSIINKKSSVDEVLGHLSLLAKVPETVAPELKASDKLRQVRSLKAKTSEKIRAFINHLTKELGVDYGENKEGIREVFSRLEHQESSTGTNALLVNTANKSGAVVPLQFRLLEGSGKVQCLVPGEERFKKAIERAQRALVAHNLLRSTTDVECSLDITEAEYHGDSIALAAAMGIYASARGMPIDPYTAFTGNINLEHGKYKVKGIQGLEPKLDAAILSGCRRVFIPNENISEVPDQHKKSLIIIPVENILEVLSKLQCTVEPLPENRIQNIKINALRAYCKKKGWPLSVQKHIQAGLQFVVSPPTSQKLIINLYDTGSHTSNKADDPDYQELLKCLNDLDKAVIPIQTVNRTINVPDIETRLLIQKALDRLGPVDRKDEPHCLFSQRFEALNEKMTVKQYHKGTLQFQGRAGALFKDIVEAVFTACQLTHPNASLKVDDFINHADEQGASSKKNTGLASLRHIALPHIGTDESGKGDYFGPMVIAGSWMDESLKKKLEDLGVKDSKELSDKNCRELAARIRSLCQGRFEVVEIPPERYNALYEEFIKEGKNLNHLLAWGHARAIETLLGTEPCHWAIADQFGNEKFILSKLMEKGKKIELFQTHKGERYTAVAAASILARDRFLARLEAFSQNYGIELPKGASEAVVLAGRQFVAMKGSAHLGKVAKLHHKTTHKILGKSQILGKS